MVTSQESEEKLHEVELQYFVEKIWYEIDGEIKSCS